MYKSSEIKATAQALYTGYLSMLDKLSDVKSKEMKTVVKGKYDEAHEAASEICNSIENAFRSTLVEGVGVRDFFMSIKTFEKDGKLSHIEFNIRSKIGSPIKYKERFEIPASENFLNEVGGVFATSLIQMYYISAARDNIDEVNAYLKDLCEKSEIPYTVAFEVSTDGDYVVDIADDHITFGATLTGAFEAGSLAEFWGGDGYLDLVQAEEEAKLVETLKSCQTPVQLIKSKVNMVSKLTEANLRKRADRILRLTYHKQAIYFNQVKAGIGYYTDTVKVNGEEVRIFSLLSKDKEGNIEVVLTPFDIKTLLNVDYNVVKAVKKVLK